ncbi:MAG TPA: HupE/UreJ family protein [Vicinamibacterales bacterium]|nr:HupE/UreJ family protein [Vicinamibacterales bacterium]
MDPRITAHTLAFSMRRGRRCLRWRVVALTLLLIPVQARAHEVAVEQIVNVVFQPQGDRLAVRAQLPATALSDAKLPLLADGTLDQPAMARLLPVVAADVARNLDVQQDGTALPAPSAAARLGADRKSIDVDLTYRIDRADRISARLNTFRSPPLQPVRTIARYLPPAGHAQTISVVGPPSRVAFDPDVVEAVPDFITRALTAVMAFGDHLLLLVCLLVPARRPRDAARVMGALIAGQALGYAAAARTTDALANALPVAALIASSAIVVAAIQNMVGARLGLVAASTAMFGLLNGLAFGQGFATARQFAGSHQFAAFVVFFAVVALAELWLGAILAATRRWLDLRDSADRIVTVVTSAAIAHTAIHLVDDRGRELAQGGTFAAEHAVFAVALGWAAVMVIVAAVAALRDGRVREDAARAARRTDF